MKVKIPAALREQVWIHTYGDKYFLQKCSVTWCKTMISPFSFHMGHNVPESKGGATDLNNLQPICARCNLSMGSQYTIDEFSKLSNPAENPWNCFRCLVRKSDTL